MDDTLDYKRGRTTNTDIALEFLRRTFGGKQTSSPTVHGTDGDNTSVEVLSSDDHVCRLTFSKEGWERLHEVGMLIGTTEPSQIIRRALATLWLVASGQCELIDKTTGKQTKIPA